MKAPRVLSHLSAVMLLLPILGTVSGCETWREEKKKEEERKQVHEDMAEIRRALEPGEKVIFDFEADSYWHPTPYAAYRDHQLIIRTAKDARHLPLGVIEFGIGPLKQHLRGENAFIITQPGPIYFKMKKGVVPGFAGQVAVEIERVK